MKKIYLFTMFSALLTGVSAHADVPKITGKPVIDTPAILAWPLDNGNALPSLHNPTSNTLYDLHGAINECDLVLSTEGNYHMALHDVWPLVLKKFEKEPLHNAMYTTSPPVVVPQLEKGLVQFDNVNLTCRPSVMVANKKVIDKVIAAGGSDGDPQPLYQDRGVVILVKKGNPKKIHTVWDLGRKGVHLITPNPDLEAGAFGNYSGVIYNVAANDPHPPKGWTAEKLFDTVFNGKSKDPKKWLAGARIHHRDEPWSVAHGQADAALILYHLGRYTQESFPDTLEIVPIGGTVEDPQPAAGVKTSVRFVMPLKGEWTPKQKAAREAMIEVLQSEAFTEALVKHGLQRPAAAK